MNVSIFCHDEIDIPNTENVNIEKIDSLEDGSIENLYLNDCLDHIPPVDHSQLLLQIHNVLSDNGLLYIQGPDLKQTMIATVFNKINIQLAQMLLYNKRTFSHTAQNIKDILESNNYIIISQKYINIFEYHFIFKKA